MHYSGILCNGISHCIAAWSDLMENCIGCCLVVYIFCVIYRSLIDSHHSCSGCGNYHCVSVETYACWVFCWHQFTNMVVQSWRRSVVVSRVRRWTKLTHVGPGYNWDGWPSSGGYTILVCNQPTRSTQPCIPPGSLNRVPASAGVKAGMSPLPGGR